MKKVIKIIIISTIVLLLLLSILLYFKHTLVIEDLLKHQKPVSKTKMEKIETVNIDSSITDMENYRYQMETEYKKLTNDLKRNEILIINMRKKGLNTNREQYENAHLSERIFQVEKILSEIEKMLGNLYREKYAGNNFLDIPDSILVEYYIFNNEEPRLLEFNEEVVIK